MKNDSKTAPAAKKAGTLASASFKREAKQEEVQVENEKGNQCQNDAKQTVDTRRAGIASGAGIGVDLVRFHGVVLGLELHGMTLLARGGLITTSGIALGLSFD